MSMYFILMIIIRIIGAKCRIVLYLDASYQFSLINQFCVLSINITAIFCTLKTFKKKV